MREWKTIKEYEDILFDYYNGIAKITINRPRYRNAFTPKTTAEISDALYYCRECQDINVVVLTGAGDKAFCSGGDMHVKGHGGYVGTDGVPRLNVLDVQKQIRSLPKCWTYRNRSAPCPNPSSPWSTAMPSAAATSCTWYAT